MLPACAGVRRVRPLLAVCALLVAGGNYITVGGVAKCLSTEGINSMDATAKVTVKASTSSVVNADNSSTQTTEKTATVCDPTTGQCSSSRTTSTVTKDAAGNVVGGSSGTANTVGKGSDDPNAGQCAKEPDSPMCRKGTVADKGKFDPRDADIEAAKNDLKAAFARVKGEASQLFGSFATGRGSMPCNAPITILGQSFSLCFTAYEGQLSVIGLAIYLGAALATVFLILKR